MDPRVPQILTFISAPRSVARPGGPENRDRALRAVCGEDREGGGLDPVASAVGGADLEVGVRGPAVADRDHQGQLVVGNRLAALVEGAEERPPLLRPDRSQLLEALA